MILLDTNFAVMLANTRTVKLDQLNEIYGKVEFVAIPPVVRELSLLATQTTPKRRLRFQRALRYLMGLRMLEGEYPAEADKALIEASVRNTVPVATLDRGLKARLRRRGVPVVSLSAGKILVEGSIIR